MIDMNIYVICARSTREHSLRLGLRLVLQRHPVSIRASLCIWFLKCRERDFPRLASCTSHQYFMRHSLFLGYEEGPSADPSLDRFDFVFAPYFQEHKSCSLMIGGERTRPSPDGMIGVDEFSLVLVYVPMYVT